MLARRFGLTLEELVELYQNPAWRRDGYGGNTWGAITAAVIELGHATDMRDAQAATAAGAAIREMRHNTGAVGEKLATLESWLEQGRQLRSR